MRKPKVCIIMPVYNGASTIELALKSLISQTYSNWECVIVNDGSTDDTKMILDSLHDSRFRIYHLVQNKGRGFARQYALEHSEGEYLTYLDADDFYHTHKLETQVKMLMDNSDLDLVATEVLVFGNDLSPVGKRVKANSKPIKYRFGDKLSISMPTAMIRLERAKKVSYHTSLDASEDVDYFSRYLDGGVYQHVDYPYYYYYVTRSNTPYKKVLHYTTNEMKRGLFMFGKANLAAVRVVGKSIIKWCIYAISMPVIGEEFFLRHRNTPLSAGDEQTFRQQLSIIESTKL